MARRLGAALRKRGVLTATLAVLGAAIVALVVGVLSSPAREVAAVGSGAAVGGLLGIGAERFLIEENLKIRHSIERLQIEVRQVRALTNIRPVLSDIPLVFDEWTIEPLLAEILGRLVLEVGPHLVLECGSGTSTVLIASCLRIRGEGRVVALEHDPAYAERSRRLVSRAGLTRWAEVRDTPLRQLDVKGWAGRWYDVDVIADLDPGTAEILFVDGPPGDTGNLARYPAVPLLRPYLREGCTVILDDGIRAEEDAIARRWTEETGGSLQRLPTERKAFRLDLPRSS